MFTERLDRELPSHEKCARTKLGYSMRKNLYEKRRKKKRMNWVIYLLGEFFSQAAFFYFIYFNIFVKLVLDWAIL